MRSRAHILHRACRADNSSGKNYLPPRGQNRLNLRLIESEGIFIQSFINIQFNTATWFDRLEVNGLDFVIFRQIRLISNQISHVRLIIFEQQLALIRFI